VMFGTGGRTAHAALTVWQNNELFVVESTDANPFGAVYWPPPYGVIRTPWLKWIELAKKADYLVNYLPLRANVRAQFNESSFWRWFNTVQGHPYGYHNFIYSFLDTFPSKNLPQPLDENTLTMFVTTFDRILPSNDTTGVNAYSLFTEGLNLRLGTNCFRMDCISKALQGRGLTLGAATAMAELDAWRYDGGNTSMGCSVFAAAAWKAGFGSNWPEIQATEQTPKDNYQMAIFDGAFFTPQNCPIGLASDPTGVGTYCQLMGAWKMPMNNYNSIPIYKGMNSKCPSQWPSYERCPKDNPTCC